MREPANANPAVSSGSSVFDLPGGANKSGTYTATAGSLTTSCVVSSNLRAAPVPAPGSAFRPCPRAELLISTREVHAPEGWSLLNESTPPDQAYLVIDGTLEVVHHGKRIAELGPGDTVGEIGLTKHGLRTGTVTAVSSLEMHLTHKDFQGPSGGGAPWGSRAPTTTSGCSATATSRR